jgi:hypothetical protein
MMETDPVSEMSCFLEYRTMEKVQICSRLVKMLAIYESHFTYWPNPPFPKVSKSFSWRSTPRSPNQTKSNEASIKHIKRGYLCRAQGWESQWKLKWHNGSNKGHFWSTNSEIYYFNVKLTCTLIIPLGKCSHETDLIQKNKQ